MTLFEVKLPPLPRDKPIYEISTTPLLKRAKTLWIASLCISILAGILLFMEYASAIDQTRHVFLIVQFFATLCTIFAFYYLSKLSRRIRLFKLYALNFGITLILVIFQSYLYFVLHAIVLPITLYLMWQIGKELSFISNDSYYFKGTKIIIISLIVAMAGMGIGLLLGLGGFQNEFVLDMFVSVSACILLVGCLAGGILFLIAMLRLRLIIAYGEESKNPLK